MEIHVAAVAASQVLVEESSPKFRLTFIVEQILSIPYKNQEMHLTLTPAQAAKIAQMSAIIQSLALTTSSPGDTS